MDSSTLMIEIVTWVLMIAWLAFVVVSGVLAFRKWQRTEGSVRLQMGYLWIGAAIVCAGDLLHTIGGTISAYTGSTTGSVSVAGTVFEARTFTMFFDALVFIVYYTLWALFIVARYQQGAFKPHDKIVTGLALAAMVLILPGAVPNALGIYTLEYIIAVWAPHITLFIIFGVMTVYKLIRCSRDALARTADPLTQTQERTLSRTGAGFAFSFLFFFLSLALIPVNGIFGMFMIPKTFAYMFAFYNLIKGFIVTVPAIKGATH